ncbi:MAG TPA: PIG-L family deacetylase [Dictyoglomaceae bacterium]|nr:PIG-L family deacetylase [Dictyoglomaceae bacterium]
MKSRFLVIAPHADDEILGVGGTIARLIDEGWDSYILICTKGYPPDFDEDVVKKIREEAKLAHKYLGVKETVFLDFPAANLDGVFYKELNKSLLQILENIKPDIIFIPFNSDLHIDHQKIFSSSLVASRPGNSFTPKKIYTYETLSETNWNAPYLTTNFAPNVFVDISHYLDKKIEAITFYKSQLKEFPHERSIEAIRALAMLRGSTINTNAAEAFVLIREII